MKSHNQYHPLHAASTTRPLPPSHDGSPNTLGKCLVLSRLISRFASLAHTLGKFVLPFRLATLDVVTGLPFFNAGLLHVLLVLCPSHTHTPSTHAQADPTADCKDGKTNEVHCHADKCPGDTGCVCGPGGGDGGGDAKVDDEDSSGTPLRHLLLRVPRFWGRYLPWKQHRLVYSSSSSKIVEEFKQLVRSSHMPGGLDKRESNMKTADFYLVDRWGASVVLSDSFLKEQCAADQPGAHEYTFATAGAGLGWESTLSWWLRLHAVSLLIEMAIYIALHGLLISVNAGGRTGGGTSQLSLMSLVSAYAGAIRSVLVPAKTLGSLVLNSGAGAKYASASVVATLGLLLFAAVGSAGCRGCGGAFVLQTNYHRLRRVWSAIRLIASDILYTLCGTFRTALEALVLVPCSPSKVASSVATVVGGDDKDGNEDGQGETEVADREIATCCLVANAAVGAILSVALLKYSALSPAVAVALTMWALLSITPRAWVAVIGTAGIVSAHWAMHCFMLGSPRPTAIHLEQNTPTASRGVSAVLESALPMVLAFLQFLLLHVFVSMVTLVRSVSPVIGRDDITLAITTMSGLADAESAPDGSARSFVACMQVWAQTAARAAMTRVHSVMSVSFAGLRERLSDNLVVVRTGGAPAARGNDAVTGKLVDFVFEGPRQDRNNMWKMSTRMFSMAWQSDVDLTEWVQTLRRACGFTQYHNNAPDLFVSIFTEAGGKQVGNGHVVRGQQADTGGPGLLAVTQNWVQSEWHESALPLICRVSLHNDNDETIFAQRWCGAESFTPPSILRVVSQWTGSKYVYAAGAVLFIALSVPQQPPELGVVSAEGAAGATGAQGTTGSASGSTVMVVEASDFLFHRTLKAVSNVGSAFVAGTALCSVIGFARLLWVMVWARLVGVMTQSRTSCGNVATRFIACLAPIVALIVVAYVLAGQMWHSV